MNTYNEKQFFNEGVNNKKGVLDTFKAIEKITTIICNGDLDFENPNWKRSRSVKDFARWCNNRFIFKTCKWEDYKKKEEHDENQMTLF